MTISKLINNLLFVITMLAFIAQLFIDLSTVNIAASMIILLSAFITIFYLRWSSALETNPLSSFAILGFCFTSTLGALWAQSFAWTAVTENLRQPLVTFSWLTLFQVIAIVAHCVYRKKANSPIIKEPNLLRRLFDWMGLYEPQTASVMWLIGVFGLFCLLFSYKFPVANGFSFLAWAPFLIPIYYIYEGEKYCNIKANFIYLAIHSSLIVLLAMLFNTRGMIFLGLVTMGSVIFLQLLQSRSQINSTFLFRGIIAILLVFAISIPASNLATAMAIARDGRNKISPIKMVSNTIENFNSPEKLEKFRSFEKAQNIYLRYEEVYISNPLVKRFINTKFQDSAIYFSGRLTDDSANEILRMSGDFLWATLPQPFLDQLKVNVDKRYLMFSMGDVLSHFSVGTALGGMRTGSVFGQGLALFGYFSCIIYFGLCFILFASMDIFAKKRTNGTFLISAIGMLSLWNNFVMGISAESFHHLFMAVFRGVLQTSVLYFIAISFVKLLIKAYSTKSLISKS